MAYSSKQRKQLKVNYLKNKSKVRKTKKTKRQNKRTRRFKKQYGGKLNPEQISFVQDQIKDLGFNEEEKKQINNYFNQISQPLSKILIATGTSLLEEFFLNVNQN